MWKFIKSKLRPVFFFFVLFGGRLAEKFLVLWKAWLEAPTFRAFFYRAQENWRAAALNVWIFWDRNTLNEIISWSSGFIFYPKLGTFQPYLLRCMFLMYMHGMVVWFESPLCQSSDFQSHYAKPSTSLFFMTPRSLTSCDVLAKRNHCWS